ncbi:MAG TPA: DNA-processing protein DprA [Puia sp.]|nr:DNA-processing protein DprA [Puia sp.]
MEKGEIPYWISLAHIPGWGAAKANSIVVKFFHEHKCSIQEFFHLDKATWRGVYSLDDPDIAQLEKAREQVAGNAFLAETLLNEGYEIIPVNSSDYSTILKSNLKASHSPVILYVKGNKRLLKEDSIAIVGSREAAELSLRFTDNIARMAIKRNKVVVSGFAKGVDRQALDSAIDAKGQSIIVLPQGIMTFSSGYNEYYKEIVKGNVLVLSTFSPKAPWHRELAMARNPIIYGLANEIYVAESSEKGGTWAGVMDGLRKKRRIFVRQPDLHEQNANEILIGKGAIAVDFDGKEIQVGSLVVSEPETIYTTTESLEKKILAVLNGKPATAKEILDRLSLDLTSQKLNSLLRGLDQVEVIKSKKPYKFRLKDKNDQVYQKSLF